MNPRPQPCRRPCRVGSGRSVRWLLALLLVLLVGCAADGDPAAPVGPGPSLDIESFPAGLGRGFPVADLAGMASRATGLDAGATAPDFRMRLADGSTLTLSQLRGRPVILNFWASWCGPCRREMPDLLDRARRHGQELVVIAVNVEEDMDAIGPFAAEYDMRVPVLVDEEGVVVNLYQVRSMPTSYFVGRDGTISARWTGYMSAEILDGLLRRIL